MAHARLIIVMVLLFGALAAQAAFAGTVLFDTGHGERFSTAETGPLQLSSFAGILRGAGWNVATVDKPISDATLAGADALVISGAFSPISYQEIDAIVRFMENGGKVAVMLHIAPPLATLMDRLQVTYTNGVIQESENIIEGHPTTFRVKKLGSHPVLQGVQEISMYGVWGILNNDNSCRIIASTSPEAWVDLRGDKVKRKEATASFGVVIAGDVGKGGFLIFGDDAVFQNKFLDKNNTLLANNLAKWMKRPQPQ